MHIKFPNLPDFSIFNHSTKHWPISLSTAIPANFAVLASKSARYSTFIPLGRTSRCAIFLSALTASGTSVGISSKLKKVKQTGTLDAPAASFRRTIAWTYFLASREGTWVAAWHFAGFMRPLRIVPGPLPPSLLLFLRYDGTRQFVRSWSRCPRVFPPCPARAANFLQSRHYSTKSFARLGPLMDAHCVGIVVPLYPMGCDRIHGRLLCTKRHASSFVNRPAAMRPTQAAANLRKGKRNNKFDTLFSEPTSSNSSFFGYFSFVSSSFFLDCILFLASGSASGRYTHPTELYCLRSPFQEIQQRIGSGIVIILHWLCGFLS